MIHKNPDSILSRENKSTRIIPISGKRMVDNKLIDNEHFIYIYVERTHTTQQTRSSRAFFRRCRTVVARVRVLAGAEETFNNLYVRKTRAAVLYIYNYGVSIKYINTKVKYEKKQITDEPGETKSAGKH